MERWVQREKKNQEEMKQRERDREQRMMQMQREQQQHAAMLHHNVDGMLRNGDHSRSPQNRPPLKNGYDKPTSREREPIRVKEEPEQANKDDLAMRLNAVASGSAAYLGGPPVGVPGLWGGPPLPPEYRGLMAAPDLMASERYRLLSGMVLPPEERYRLEQMDRMAFERDFERSKFLSGVAAMGGPPGAPFVPPGASPYLSSLAATAAAAPSMGGLRGKVAPPGGAGVPPPLIPSAGGAASNAAAAAHMHKLSSMMPDKR